MAPETKQAYRQAAKLMHPDRATSEIERERRNQIMAKVNIAYENGDKAAIEKLIIEFGQDSEAIQGDDIGSRMIKAIRRIAQLRNRLVEIEKHMLEQMQHELYELMTTILQTEAINGDPLGDLVNAVMQEISERKIRYEMLKQTKNS